MKEETTLTKIVLSETDTNYHVSVEWDDPSKEFGIWGQSYDVEKNRDKLEGFLYGLVCFEDTWEAEVENYPQKDENYKPIDPKYFKRIRQTMHSWLFTGMNHDLYDED